MSEPRVRIPIGAYIMAVVSAGFVTFGVLLVFAFSGALFGNWFARVPAAVLACVPFLALLLGVLSGWQTVRQAYRKALKQAEAQAVLDAAKPVCRGCGERLEATMQTCPVCGMQRPTSAPG